MLADRCPWALLIAIHGAAGDVWKALIMSDRLEDAPLDRFLKLLCVLTALVFIVLHAHLGDFFADALPYEIL